MGRRDIGYLRDAQPHRKRTVLPIEYYTARADQLVGRANHVQAGAAGAGVGGWKAAATQPEATPAGDVSAPAVVERLHIRVVERLQKICLVVGRTVDPSRNRLQDPILSGRRLQ